VFANIEKIAALFDDFHIVIAFDVSNDNTLHELCQAKRRFGKMEILINKNPLSEVRTQNIANARNSIVQYIKQSADVRHDFAYFIMMDFDDVCAGEMRLETLQKYVQAERDGTPYPWDALSFNRPGYYDLWALSLNPFLYSCWSFPNGRAVVETMRKYVLHELDKLAKHGGDVLLPCSSAFNGFAMYRIAAFEGISYEWTASKNMEVITQGQVETMCAIVRQRVGRKPHDEDCEHRYFHMKATQVNGARICISPLALFTEYFVC
jgi:hypothetical protein